MSSTLKNIIEIVEAEGNYENALKHRTKHIKTFSSLGPPDLCYLTKECKGSFGKGNKTGFYHYVYGAHMSSIASLSLYITNLLKLQEQEVGWFSGGKWIITKGIYCIFDSFNRIDVRAEVTFPGGVKVYGVDKEERRVAVSESDFSGPFISTVLRTFNPERVPAVKMYKVLSSKEVFNEFIREVFSFVKVRDLEYDNQEMIFYKGNKILHYVTDYLIRKKRLTMALDIMNQVIEQDIKHTVFIADIFASMNKVPEAIKIIAPVLSKNPHIVVLLYTEAQNLLKVEKYEFALTLAKIVVQLCPDSFDAWYLLIEILFYSKNYSQALVAINIAPIYSKRQPNDGILIDEQIHMTNPKANEQSDHYPNFVFEPQPQDFHFNKFREELNHVQNEYFDENERVLTAIKDLPALKLEAQELKLYKVLVRIERELGWDKLLNLRTKMFLMEADTASNKFDSTSYKSKLEDYEIYEHNATNFLESPTHFMPGMSMNEQSFYGVKAGGEEIIEQKLREDYDSDDSVDEAELPSFLKADENYETHQKVLSSNLQAIKQHGQESIQHWEHKRPQKITEETESTETEPHDKLKFGKKPSQPPTVDNPVQLDFEVKRKRLCSRMMDNLFVTLYEDLNLMYEWQNEENGQKNPLHAGGFRHHHEEGEEEDEPEHYIGLIWVQRGILAERLCRIRFAEKAYKKSIEKGFSSFAWTRLYKLYVEANNPKAALICLAEILDDMDNIGIEKFSHLPSWIEDPMYSLIANMGINKFRALLEEVSWDDDTINMLLKDGEYWNAEGWKVNDSFVDKLSDSVKERVVKPEKRN